MFVLRAPTFFEYDTRRIAENVSFLRAHVPGATLVYSLKCNPFPGLVRFMKSQGLGVDAASAGEVAFARSCGFAKEEIFYSAPGKCAEDIAAAMDSCVFVADSFSELDRINAIAMQKEMTFSVGIRINTAISMKLASDGEIEYHGTSSKFGIDEELVYSNVEKLRSYSNIKIAGMHFYIRSQINNEDSLINITEYCFAVFQKLQKFFDGRLTFINIGGGFGIPLSPKMQHLSLETFQHHLASLSEKFKGVSVYAESGRFLVSESGSYYTRIEDIKISRGVTYYITAGTLHGFLRPVLARVFTNISCTGTELYPCEPLFSSNECHQISVVTLNGCVPQESCKVHVVGNLCTALDCIAENIVLSKAEVGDYIRVSNAGAYTDTHYFLQDSPPMMRLKNTSSKFRKPIIILPATRDTAQTCQTIQYKTFLWYRTI